MKENIIEKKSFDFAVEIVETYKHLAYEKREFVLSKQPFCVQVHQSEQIFQRPLEDNLQKILFINFKA
jgi:hypothetical protein